MISGVSHKICSLHRKIPNSLVLFDSKKTDIEAHESWVGGNLQDFFLKKLTSPKENIY